MTQATIGSIVQGLLDDGVLARGRSGGGRRRQRSQRPLWFAAGAGAAVMVDIRASGARMPLIDARGDVFLERAAAFDDTSSPDAVAGTVRRLATDLARRGPVIGVGIAVPGSTDLATGEVVGSIQVPGAVGRRLRDDVAQATGLPTFVENDSRAQALAEWWFGAGRGLSTYASVQTGDGLSVGLVLDGAVYRGPNGLAGELGHTTVAIDGEPCTCGLRGCWETIAALAWLRRRGRELGLRGARDLDAERLAALARRDARASALLDEYADHVAVGLANLRSLLGVEHYVVHGDVVGGGDELRRLLNDAIDRRALGRVRVVFSDLGERASILGAAAVVLAELLHAPG
ncbi:MAG: ROK family protein [Ilumatobacteraceae bacterium]